MKLLYAAIFLIFFVNMGVEGNDDCSAGRKKRAITSCVVRDPDSGALSVVIYDNCNQTCCGLELTPRLSPDTACCGTQAAGEIYNRRTQLCCALGQGQIGGDEEPTFEIYERNNISSNAVCCGTRWYNPTMSACCGSYLVPPRPFNVRTEMCCMGIVSFAGNTAYTSCCGNSSYDRRVASCPCDNGVIALVPQSNASCCRNGPAGTLNGYNTYTQACCYGVPYTTATQFCCGGRWIGNTATERCCGNGVVPLVTSSNSSNAGCCRLSGGNYVTFNMATSACCGGRVLPRTPGIEQICCGGELVNTATSGDRCCDGNPYFSANNTCCIGRIEPGDACCGGNGFDSNGNVCCGGVVAAGDACCNNVPYTTSAGNTCCGDAVVFGTACCGDAGYFPNQNQICCAGQLNITFARLPACCVGQVFDAFSQTCCGSIVYPNPFIPGSVPGSTVRRSRNTRCCGDVNVPNSLRPYDYLYQLCCPNGVFSTGGLADTSVCCGNGTADLASELCCDGIARVNNYAGKGRCCDDEVYNNKVQGCCDGEIYNRNSTGCCDGVLYNRAISKCCDGNIVPLGDVPAGDAVCCGGVVIDGSVNKCCGNESRPFGIISRMYGICCGNGVVDSRDTVCCDNVPNPRLDNVPNAVCCGTSLMDPAEQKCCDDEPRNLNGIPPAEAICCGDGCIDGREFWCCDGRQYRRGVLQGDAAGADCRTVLPPPGPSPSR